MHASHRGIDHRIGCDIVATVVEPHLSLTIGKEPELIIVMVIRFDAGAGVALIRAKEWAQRGMVASLTGSAWSNLRLLVHLNGFVIVEGFVAVDTRDPEHGSARMSRKPRVIEKRVLKTEESCNLGR